MVNGSYNVTDHAAPHLPSPLQSNMNTRANIMFFIEHFLEMASRAPSDHYVHMMQRDIIRVVDAVCPEDGSGVANVKVVRKVSTLRAVHAETYSCSQLPCRSSKV